MSRSRASAHEELRTSSVRDVPQEYQVTASWPAPMFATVPEELLVHIFSWLSIPDLCKASTVCKHWFNLIQHTKEIWKERLLPHLYSLHYLEENGLASLDRRFFSPPLCCTSTPLYQKDDISESEDLLSYIKKVDEVKDAKNPWLIVCKKFWWEGWRESIDTANLRAWMSSHLHYFWMKGGWTEDFFCRALLSHRHICLRMRSFDHMGVCNLLCSHFIDTSLSVTQALFLEESSESHLLVPCVNGSDAGHVPGLIAKAVLKQAELSKVLGAHILLGRPSCFAALRERSFSVEIRLIIVSQTSRVIGCHLEMLCSLLKMFPSAHVVLIQGDGQQELNKVRGFMFSEMNPPSHWLETLHQDILTL